MSPSEIPLPPPVAPPAPLPPRSWLQRRVLDPLLDQLKAGLAPGPLALTVGLGVAIGLIPAFGITTLLSAAVALRLRLNVAIMQLATHLMTFFQLALLIPLLRAGAIIMGQGDKVAHLTVASLRQLIAREGWAAVGKLLWRAAALGRRRGRAGGRALPGAEAGIRPHRGPAGSTAVAWILRVRALFG